MVPIMDDKQPTQVTRPKKGEPVEIPVPEKDDVLDSLRRAAKASRQGIPTGTEFVMVLRADVADNPRLSWVPSEDRSDSVGADARDDACYYVPIEVWKSRELPDEEPERPPRSTIPMTADFCES